MDFEDCQTAIPVGAVYRDTAVKTSWSQKGLIESIRAVGSGQHDHGLTCIKAVHLNEQLVARLFTLIVCIDAGPTLATNGVNFVDKDDARGCFFGLVKQVAHAASSNADQHFDELRPTHREEWHT